MFNTIARNYDFLNHFLSFGIDVIWRKRLIREMKKFNPTNLIDIATGTADLAIMAIHKGIYHVTGIDLSENMVAIGNYKIRKYSLENSISLVTCDAEALPFNDRTFDAAMVAFGVRNFENLDKGLMEIYRVLKDNSRFFILEFSQPDNVIFKKLYHFYSFHVLPKIGKIISKDNRAYHYLPESINEFPYGKEMLGILERNGFKDCYYIPLTFQIASIYIGTK